MAYLIDLSVILILIAGIHRFRTPRGARFGNLAAGTALMCAFILILYRHGVVDKTVVIFALTAGGALGYGLARAVNMIQIPAMVAFQHGAGGVAAFMVSFIELMRSSHAIDLVSEVSGVLGLAIGALTFSGSMVASAKLSNKMGQAPQLLPAHNILSGVNLVAVAVVGLLAIVAPGTAVASLYVTLIVLSAGLGVMFSVRIGGADMPVLISFLNATAGFAAALCGMVIENRLLIAFGATVAASGSILTHVMCKAMNRSVVKVFLPHRVGTRPLKRPTAMQAADRLPEKGAAVKRDPYENASAIVRRARSVIIIPGYGMALAKAQKHVAELANQMTAMQKEVKYAIHPVAGRMPGHMNVLLAEAGVDYDMFEEMENINPVFPNTDLALIVGACDVVNPAAIDVEGTPISGMPILMAHQAKNVICCNYDNKPGYSGVENPLYQQSNTILLPGDAGQTIRQLQISLLDNHTGIAEKKKYAVADALEVLMGAKKVIIIPGYGMALAKAQFKVAELASLLAGRGAGVKYAIHPVAGRMPGHMNVILAEAEVEYEDLLEMEEANPMFVDTDVALVIGACDVVNPAALKTEGTPISGMPILEVHKAAKIIVCNLDEKPGYSGVSNPLYENPNTIHLLGDAKQSTRDLISGLS